MRLLGTHAFLSWPQPKLKSHTNGSWQPELLCLLTVKAIRFFWPRAELGWQYSISKRLSPTYPVPQLLAKTKRRAKGTPSPSPRSYLTASRCWELLFWHLIFDFNWIQTAGCCPTITTSPGETLWTASPGQRRGKNGELKGTQHAGPAGTVQRKVAGSREANAARNSWQKGVGQHNWKALFY